MKIIKLLFAIFIIIFVFGCDDKMSAKIGKTAPEISAINLNNEKIKINDNNYKDMTKVLVFWQYGCAGCLQYIPKFDKMMQNNKNLLVLAINTFNDDKTVRKYYKESKLENVQILEDELQITFKRYDIKSIPTIIVIDRNGIFREKIKGDAPCEYILEKLSHYL